MVKLYKYRCPNCGNEIEIRTKEAYIKCSCGKDMKLVEEEKDDDIL